MDFFNNSSTVDCYTTLSVVSNPWVPVLLILQSALCFMAMVTNSLLIVVLSKTSSLHYNVRFLLGNLATTGLAYGGAMGAKCMYNVIVAFTDPCSLLVTNRMCKSSEIAVIAPLLANGYCLLVIGLERLYATAYYRTYESMINRPLSILLAVLAWACGFTITITTTLSASDRPIAFCVNTLATNRAAAVTYLSITCGLETAAILIFLVNLIINRRQLRFSGINQANHTLSARFQLSANIRMCEMMWPTAAAHAAAWIPVLMLVVVFTGSSSIAFVYKVIGILSGQMLLSIFCIGYPIVFILKNAGLRKESAKLFPNLFGKLIVVKNRHLLAMMKVTDPFNGFGTNGVHDSAKVATNHFDMLGKMWNSVGMPETSDAPMHAWRCPSATKKSETS